MNDTDLTPMLFDCYQVKSPATCESTTSIFFCELSVSFCRDVSCHHRQHSWPHSWPAWSSGKSARPSSPLGSTNIFIANDPLKISQCQARKQGSFYSLFDFLDSGDALFLGHSDTFVWLPNRGHSCQLQEWNINIYSVSTPGNIRAERPSSTNLQETYFYSLPLALKTCNIQSRPHVTRRVDVFIKVALFSIVAHTHALYKIKVSEIISLF